MSRFGLRPSRVATCLALSLLLGCQSALDRTTATPSATSPSANPGRHAQLAAAIAGTDRIVMRRMQGDAIEVILDTRGPHLAEEFLAHVQIDDFAGDFHCDCGPVQILEFYRGDVRLAELSLRSYQRWVRWHNGAWRGDALVRGEYPQYPQSAFAIWFKQRGGNPSKLAESGLPSDYFEKERESAEKFPAYFPPEAQDIARWIGPMRKEGFQPWREESDLRQLVRDPLVLATASFRALGMVRQPWYEDDVRIGKIQTAVSDLPPEDFIRALRANATDDQAMRGAARIYFRLSVHQRLPSAANVEWLPVLADAMLRTGQPRDMPFVFLYLAASREPAAWQFLREVAGGKRRYPWPAGCQPVRTQPHEPSLRASAAVLLALSGDRQAARLVAAVPAPVFGLDAAAREITASLLDPTRPLRPSHFRYDSRILTYAATEAALRQPPEMIPGSVFGAALVNNDYSFNRQIVGQLFPIARRLELALYREPAQVSVSDAPVDQDLVTTAPEEAIRQCTEKLPASHGNARTALLLLRALTHENLGHTAEALADYLEALKATGFTPNNVHFRVAFMYWTQDRVDDALKHIELGLQAKPDADLFTMRGMTKYAAENFGNDADLDFTAALALQRNHGYAEIFQHLCAHLSGRPELSRLSGTPQYPVPPPMTIGVGPGPSLSLDLSGGAIPIWPAAIISFLKGNIDAAQLLEQAKQAEPAVARTQNAEACFYISQKARLARDDATEREYLQRCVALEATQIAENRLAVVRLGKLR